METKQHFTQSEAEGNKLVPKLRFPEFEYDREWQKKPFSKLFKIGSGRDYKHLEKGTIPVYGTGGYMLSVNDFLYDGKSACIGRKGTINKPMFLTGKFWTVDTLFYTHSFEDCSPEFVYLLFQNINWLNYNEAGGVPSLSKVIINKIEVYIPKSSEQKKIVAFISSLDTLITAETEKLAYLKDHKKGLLQQLFPAKGESKPQYRFPEFVGDGEWEEKELQSLCFNISSGKDKNIDGGEFDLYGSTGVIGKTKSSSYKGFFILVARVGANAGLLNVANGEFGVTDNTLVINLKESKKIDFIFYSLSKAGLNKLVFGSGQPLITGRQLKDLIIPIPKKPREQEKIANCLSSADELIQAQIEKIATLKEHKKGLMQQLFPLSKP